MTLTALNIPMDARLALPARVESFLADADGRHERFVDCHRDQPAAGFVPSDYDLVYRALHGMREAAAGTLLTGDSFCEWGSGLGVIACLASMLGFDSVGIEIDARLVAASRSLALDHRIRVELVHGSYVPDGHATEEDFDESHVMTLQDGRAAYADLGLEPDDFDVVFAYPWPGEDQVVTDIFQRYAARGAILMTYHGQDGLMLRRKVR